MKNKIRNFIWIITGIILMAILVLATTTIRDVGINTINISASGNITADYYLGSGAKLYNVNESKFLAENVSLWNEAKNKYNSTYNTHINNLTLHNSTYWYNQTTPAMTYEYNQSIPAMTYTNANCYNKSANINTGGYNTTTTTITITQIIGVCDLTISGSICKNATGTYIVG